LNYPPFERDIVFANVNFRYSDGGDDVLKGLNLTVRKGESVALVGASGSGKTTVARLIPRFFDPQAGSVLVDGFDIRRLTFESLRSQIAIVTQETILFDATIRYNIAYGRLDATDEEIEQAARAANAHNFIMSMPNGYNTEVGERGGQLSGGQRQRLAIARALLRNAPILILDEATSALDNESEKLVQEALDHLMENRTSVVIAHRLSTIRNADRIVVLQDGQVIEEGTHQELLARSGRYLELIRAEEERSSRRTGPGERSDLAEDGLALPSERAHPRSGDEGVILGTT
jgi:ABC-type multidrug transport system fused ATPase/permease subunit